MRRINAAQCSKNVKIVLLILGVDKGAHYQFTKKNSSQTTFYYYVSISLLDNAPNYKVGCIIQKKRW